MKIQIIYSSLSGRTEKVARAIYDQLSLTPADTKSLHNLKDGTPELDGDIILFGYWVNRGGPNDEMKALLSSVENRVVGLFCTLGYFADAAHGVNSIQSGVDLVKDRNTVIGSYVCNGAISEDMIAHFRAAKPGSFHSATPENEIRWKVMKDHPTACECALAAERFSERITLYRMHKEQNVPFTPIV